MSRINKTMIMSGGFGDDIRSSINDAVPIPPHECPFVLAFAGREIDDESPSTRGKLNELMAVIWNDLSPAKRDLIMLVLRTCPDSGLYQI